MRHNCKQIDITLPSEWEKDLARFKQERFDNQSQAEMLGYLISLGLDVAERAHRETKEGGGRNG